MRRHTPGPVRSAALLAELVDEILQFDHRLVVGMGDRLGEPLAQRGLARFPGERFKVGSDVDAPDAVLLRSHKLAAGDIPASVQAIARAGAGVNNVPVAECTNRGVVVFNTPGANTRARTRTRRGVPA